ncbi:NYN domain-containing protein, partial [Jannaschia donghaensis]|uniref:NYN domain-containing protein n=1 Tax=Jannaschia donghaensis TaxID=420998 RepID=UPI0006D7D7E2
MSDLSPFPLHSSAIAGTAVLVDGDNVAAKSAQRILSQVKGQTQVCKVFAADPKGRGWDNCPGFEVVWCSIGDKNVTDTTLCVEAMRLALVGGVERFVLATADADFVPLARALLAMGRHVTIIVDNNCTDHLAKAGSAFVDLREDGYPEDEIARILIKAIKGEGKDGLLVSDLNAIFRKETPDFKISTTSDKTWR